MLNLIWEPHISRIGALPIDLVMQGLSLSCCKFTTKATVNTQIRFLQKPDTGRVDTRGRSVLKLTQFGFPVELPKMQRL